MYSFFAYSLFEYLNHHKPLLLIQVPSGVLAYESESLNVIAISKAAKIVITQKCFFIMFPPLLTQNLRYDNIIFVQPACWNWQTRQTQNLLVATPCGFDPRRRQYVINLGLLMGTFFIPQYLQDLQHIPLSVPSLHQ